MLTSRTLRPLALAGSALVACVLAGPAYATTAHSSSAHRHPAHGLPHKSSGVIPFTQATVTPGKKTGTLTVSWAARGVRHVRVYAGISPTGPMHYVGSGHGTGNLTVKALPNNRREYLRLVPNHGGSLTVAERDLGLASDSNFRDAGGYRTTTGQWVRVGKVYRSGALTLSAADLATVNHLGIRTVYDLRTTDEIAAAPDVVPAKATDINLNVIGTAGGGSIPPGITTPEQAQEVMREGEVAYVTSPAALQAYHDLFTDIAKNPGASDYHCTAGKDRTGWASAVLLTLLGVPQKTVMQDYLLSNTYFLDSPAIQGYLAGLPSDQRAIYVHFIDVEASYLQAGLDAVQQHYGSMQNYALHGLKLSPATLHKLRAEMLVGPAPHHHR